MSYTRRWYDTFNTASGPEGMTSHTVNTGGPYTLISTSGSPNIRVDDTNNAMLGDTSGGSWNGYWKPAATLTQDGGYIQADVTLRTEFASGSTSQIAWLGSSRSSDNLSDYRLAIGNNNGASASLTLYRNGISVGTSTYAASLATAFSLVWQWTPSGQHTVAVNGGSALIDYTDSSPLDPGGFVIGMSGSFDAGDRIRLDNVQGFELDAAGPVITGPSGGAGASTSTKSIAENTTAVHTFTADVAVTWSKNGGADAARFNIDSSTGALTFAAAPDYENPVDADTNNTYVVVVRATATSGGATADQTCTVTVTNATEVPLAPTIGTATAGNASASVSFTPPTNTGRPAITGYTVTSSPGSITGTGASSPITVSGLTNGTAYTFTVTATNADGTGPASAASNSVTPSAPGSGPTINTQPTTQTAKVGASATWTMAATSSGGPLVRQWKFNGGNVGSNANTYTRTGIALGDHGATVVCRATDDNGFTDTATVSLVVAVTFAGTVPAQSGTEGGSFSLALASYFSGGLSRTYAVHSGTLPTGTSLNASTGAITGTLGVAGSGSFVVRATDANSNTDDTGTISWTISAPGTGTLTSSTLCNNEGLVFADTPFTCFVRDEDSGDLILKKTGLVSDGQGVATFSDGSLPAAGTIVDVRWRNEDNGESGYELLPVE